MLLRFILVATLAASVSACASAGVPQRGDGQASGYPPDVYAHRVATSHVVLYWNCVRPEAGALRVEGVAQNPWSTQPVRFLELELVGVDGQGRTVSLVKGEAGDILIHTNQLSPFHLALRTAGSEVRFDLYYQYQFQDEEMEARLAGAAWGTPRLLAQANRFLARDVCSDTQHRVR